MEWLKKLELLEYGVYIKKPSVLVVSDLHLGYETYLIDKGVTVPKNQFNKIMKRLEQMIKKTKPATLVFAGDVQHDFSKITLETRVTLDKLIRTVRKLVNNVVFIKGNHDTFLNSLLETYEHSIKDEYETKNFLIIHGHKKVKSKKPLIAGHEHPAIVLKDEFGYRRKYKCHLVGEKLLIIPAISPLATGIVVNENQKALSPIVKDLDKLKPIVQGLEFPNIGSLKEVV